MVGPGAAGSALAAALSRCGWPVVGVAARDERAASAAAERLGLPSLGSSATPSRELLGARAFLLAVRDREIAALAARLAACGDWEGRLVLHLSGALTAEELAPLRSRGAAVGSFHPLMSFALGAGGEPATLPPDTPFFAEGDGPALELARELAEALGCPFRELRPEAKTLYHCAATIAGNLSTVLLGLGEQVLSRAGVEGGAALLAPLARESVLAAARLGPARGLSGPVVRADVGVLAGHVRSLSEAGLPTGLREAHLLLSLLAADLVEAEGRSSVELGELRALLSEALEASRRSA